jgi:hypothetical protein
VPIAYRRQENSNEVTTLLKALIELQTSQYDLLGNVSMQLASALRISDPTGERLTGAHLRMVSGSTAGHSAESLIEVVRSARVYGAAHSPHGKAAAPVTPVGAHISRAQSDSVVLATGSCYIAYSTDGGKTFVSVDPTSVFPSRDGGLCGHPIVLYASAIDRFVSLMQFEAGANGRDHLRIAAASPQEIIRGRCTAWTYWDLTSSLFAFGDDPACPDATAGTRFLYVTIDRHETGLLVLCIPLDEIRTGGTLNVRTTTLCCAASVSDSPLPRNTGHEVNDSGMRRGEFLTNAALHTSQPEMEDPCRLVIKEGSGKSLTWID